MRRFDVLDVVQGSPEWRAARLGRLTGSCADAVWAERKRGTGELEARRKLRERLVAERMAHLSQEDEFTTDALERGHEAEPLARAAYEAETGLLVQETGFLAHRDLPAGCSLDGHVGDFAGIVEIKCPKTKTHLRYLRAGVVPDDYLPQILHNLWITGAQWCDFISWDDRVPAPVPPLFVVRVHHAEDAIRAYEKKALAFLEEVDAEYRSWFGWSQAPAEVDHVVTA